MAFFASDLQENFKRIFSDELTIYWNDCEVVHVDFLDQQQHLNNNKSFQIRGEHFLTSDGVKSTEMEFFSTKSGAFFNQAFQEKVSTFYMEEVGENGGEYVENEFLVKITTQYFFAYIYDLVSRLLVSSLNHFYVTSHIAIPVRII